MKDGLECDEGNSLVKGLRSMLVDQEDSQRKRNQSHSREVETKRKRIEDKKELHVEEIKGRYPEKQEKDGIIEKKKGGQMVTY